MYATPEDRDLALRRWAKGVYLLEAGVELLIRSDWAGQLDRAGRLTPSEGGGRYAYPEVGKYLAASGYLSGGEYRQLTMIASLLGQLAPTSDTKEGVTTPFDAQLYEALPGVDHSFIILLMSAVGHAAGLHEHGGNPLPWPGESPFWKPEVE